MRLFATSSQLLPKYGSDEYQARAVNTQILTSLESTRVSSLRLRQYAGQGSVADTGCRFVNKVSTMQSTRTLATSSNAHLPIPKCSSRSFACRILLRTIDGSQRSSSLTNGCCIYAMSELRFPSVETRYRTCPIDIQYTTNPTLHQSTLRSHSQPRTCSGA